MGSWGWRSGNPRDVRYKAVECPSKFVEHVGSLYGRDGPTDGNEVTVRPQCQHLSQRKTLHCASHGVQAIRRAGKGNVDGKNVLDVRNAPQEDSEGAQAVQSEFCTVVTFHFDVQKLLPQSLTSSCWRQHKIHT